MKRVHCHDNDKTVFSPTKTQMTGDRCVLRATGGTSSTVHVQLSQQANGELEDDGKVAHDCRDSCTVWPSRPRAWRYQGFGESFSRGTLTE